MRDTNNIYYSTDYCGSYISAELVINEGRRADPHCLLNVCRIRAKLNRPRCMLPHVSMSCLRFASQQANPQSPGVLEPSPSIANFCSCSTTAGSASRDACCEC